MNDFMQRLPAVIFSLLLNVVNNIENLKRGSSRVKNRAILIYAICYGKIQNVTTPASLTKKGAYVYVMGPHPSGVNREKEVPR